jgi:hypothetical protein
MKKFEVFRGGYRYWASLKAVPGGVRWQFWSSHKWPFYHGHFTQRVMDRDEARDKFLAWIP